MGSKTWLAGRVAMVGGHVLAEKVRRPLARSQSDVPRDGMALTNQWLTETLCRNTPGAEAVSFSSPGGSVGTSTRMALRVEYNAIGRDAGLPTKLFTKTTARYAQRVLLGAAKVLDGETQFFMNLRPHLDIEAPLGYWGGVHDGSWRSIVVMEDIAQTRGAQFITATTPVTRAQVFDLVGNLAQMHGTLWEHPAIKVLKTPRDHLRNVGDMVNMAGRAKVGMERSKAVIPSALYGQADRMWKGTELALELATSSLPPTLLHGDSHIGQTYITAEGRMGLADWQAVQQGGWAYDFSYLVGSACEPEDRRAWEEDLLKAYLERLASCSRREKLSFDEAWLAYRQQLFYPYSAWAFTIGRAFYQPKMQPDEVSLKIVHRLATAINDLDSFGAIGI
jgi:hypothetical protein